MNTAERAELVAQIEYWRDKADREQARADGYFEKMYAMQDTMDTVMRELIRGQATTADMVAQAVDRTLERFIPNTSPAADPTDPGPENWEPGDDIDPFDAWDAGTELAAAGFPPPPAGFDDGAPQIPDEELAGENLDV